LKTAKCYVCNSHDIFEDHHLIPQSRGGKDGPRINLCVNCHKTCHYLARSKRLLEEIANPKLRKIVKILRISEKTLAHADTFRISLEIPAILYNRIKEEAITGRKKSISKTIQLILIEHFRRKVK
jgi:hypothetical protein